MQFHGADKGRLKYSLLRSLTRLYEPGGQMHYLISAPFILLQAVPSHWYYCDAFRSVHHNCLERPRRKEIEHADAFLPLLLERVPLRRTAICGRGRPAGDPFVMKQIFFMQILTGSLEFTGSPPSRPLLKISPNFTLRLQMPKLKMQQLVTTLFSASFLTSWIF